MLPNGFWCIQILNKCRCERKKGANRNRSRNGMKPTRSAKHSFRVYFFYEFRFFFAVVSLWSIFFHGFCWFLAHFRFSSKSFSMYFATRKTHTFASLNLYSYYIYVYRYCHVSCYLQPHIGQTKFLKRRIKKLRSSYASMRIQDAWRRVRAWARAHDNAQFTREYWSTINFY